MSRTLIGRISLTTIFCMTIGFIFVLLTYEKIESVAVSSPSLKVEPVKSIEIASAYIVADLETGRKIISFNENEVLPIASITKLFSAALFREKTGLVGTTNITWHDLAGDGRAGKLEYGQEYQYHELVHASLLESSNDAARSLLRIQPTLVTDMNNWAADSDEGAQFADASGIASDNKSAATGLAEISIKLYKEQPHIFTITTMSELIGQHTGWRNNNPFIEDESYLGGKHGFTNEAGKTAVAIFNESISDTEREFIYVILGSTDLESDMATLRRQVQEIVTVE